MSRFWRKIRIKLVMIVMMAAILAACTDRDLENVSKGLDDSAKAVAVFQETVISANEQGLVSAANTRQLLQISLKVNAAGRDAVQVTRDLTTLEPGDRTKLLGILKPVIASLAEANSSLVTLVPEARARANIASALTLLRTTLNTIQITLAAR